MGKSRAKHRPVKRRRLSLAVRNFLALNSLTAYPIRAQDTIAWEAGWYDIMIRVGPALPDGASAYISLCRIQRDDRTEDTLADLAWALETAHE